MSAADTRKTVTVLFCDVTESTQLGERLDPETLRQVLLRYWEEMRAVVERHGGTVEKFIGDAVVGVFGVPSLHEDDALRAVRSAAEMRRRIEELNEELERAWRVRLEIRVGINTGVVAAGGDGTLVTGDTVNVAARLQQTAAPGEILVGADTQRLVQSAVAAEPVVDLALKGKRDDVTAWRVSAVTAERLARRLSSPFVGRAQELASLEAAFARAVEAGRCDVVTVVGHPGVGKSRLVSEFAARTDACVATGRCLAYGDGVTFLPVAEILHQLAGITSADSAEEARGKLAALVPDADAAARIAHAIGLATSEMPGTTAEVFWALRRLFEERAAERPLVLVFEDIHWAHSTLLDLIEYLAGWSSGAPILLLCLARPDLLDARPSWAGGTILPLDGLGDADTRRLIEGLAPTLDPAVEQRVAATAEGNPLFVEELLWMLGDEGVAADATLEMPPTISAVLSARLDHLEPAERAVVQRAAVVGKQFWWSAVTELAPPELRQEVGAHLQALVRKKLVAPEAPTLLAGEDAFTFAHVLVRDAAYASLPKRLRAELHARVASWLETKAGDRAAEYAEIVGFHLEQAYALEAELRPVSPEGRAAGERAAALLAEAGRRAVGRGDARGAAALLGRAVALPQEKTTRTPLLVELGAALTATGDLAAAGRTLDEALEFARAGGDRRSEARALVERGMTEIHTLTGALDDTARVADDAAATLAADGDDAGLARALLLRAEVELIRGRLAATEATLERALVHARRARDAQQVRSALSGLGRTALAGPTPVPQAIARCAAIRHESDGDRVVATSLAMAEAMLEAMRGRFDDARALCARSLAELEELGRPVAVAVARVSAGSVELLAGDPAAAAAELRAGVDALAAVGERATLATVAAYLADALHELGDDEEAERYAALSEEASFAEDVVSQVVWRTTRAKIRCRRGDLDAAEALGREAVEFADPTDDLNMKAAALATLAAILLAREQGDDADAAYAAALALYEQKGNVVGADAVRRARAGGAVAAS